MKKVLDNWKETIKQYETPTILKERLLKPYFTHLDIEDPILDIGCGTGYFSEILAARELDVIGFDQNLIKRDSKAKYLQGNATALPFKDKMFNSVLMVNVLSCVDDVEERIKILSEAKRIKKENKCKIYVINTSEKLFNKPTNSKLLNFKKISLKKVFLSVKKIDRSKIEFEDYIITKEDMSRYCKKVGLNIFEIKEFRDLEMKREIYTLYILQ